MKKILFLLVITLITLQSCTVNSEIVYHKDAASTTFMDVDMKEAMTMFKSMMPDSLQKDKNELAELEKLPKTWTSLYDMEKKEGKLKTTNPDSIKIMKKIFMKSNFDKNELVGFSMKMDHFTKADYGTVSDMSKKDKLPVDQMAFNVWDGKTLTIDTENLNINSFKDLLSGKGLPGEDDTTESSSSMMKMMLKKMSTTLKFENKIKSITGKHNWITKVDDHTIKVDYNLDEMLGDSQKQLTNSDKKIVIVTE
ncbi:hypothetical protein PFY12_08425 [Chryseobacterium camelliae]|uniref:Lipoprotein n=1 Tax=Chryseobacterium camelliae TaxID=1265445 RepID=A0ABY7QHM4_9FLAO|nr:hypothetical protein [Chryseobacterium camelliae]WBV59089.1 hypothetical protein PFY12_08425 [Chryseobacterium camelliae]